jgi:hypothetical protein
MRHGQENLPDNHKALGRKPGQNKRVRQWRR